MLCPRREPELFREPPVEEAGQGERDNRQRHKFIPGEYTKISIE
jgi:hypothetical protein